MLNDTVKKLNIINKLLPICSSCNKVCDDNGTWKQFEACSNKYVGAKFTHSICQKCAKIIYPNVDFSELDAEKA